MRELSSLSDPNVLNPHSNLIRELVAGFGLPSDVLERSLSDSVYINTTARKVAFIEKHLHRLLIVSVLEYREAWIASSVLT